MKRLLHVPDCKPTAPAAGRQPVPKARAYGSLRESVNSRLLKDECGFIISAELILVVTLLIISAGVGFAVVKDSLATELNDISNAMGTFDQSFTINSLQAPIAGGGGAGFHSECSGFGFDDSSDQCDCQVITLVAGNTTNALGGGAPQIAGGGGGPRPFGVQAQEIQAVGAPPPVALESVETLQVQSADALVPVIVESAEDVDAAQVNSASTPARDCCPCPAASQSNHAPGGKTLPAQPLPSTSNPR